MTHSVSIVDVVRHALLILSSVKHVRYGGKVTCLTYPVDRTWLYNISEMRDPSHPCVRLDKFSPVYHGLNQPG